MVKNQNVMLNNVEKTQGNFDILKSLGNSDSDSTKKPQFSLMVVPNIICQ